MTLRDVGNWVLDQSAWWLVPYLVIWLLAALVGLAARS